MKTSFTVSTALPAEPERVFRAWLSTEGHSAMTGSPAKVEPRVGGSFSAWGGYITGKTVALRPYSRIVQSWRTSEFSEADPDSQIEIVIEPAEGGALLTLTHSDIPQGQADSYESGWEESYFAPMRKYFERSPRE